MKSKYYMHLQNLITGKEKVGHLQTSDISNVIKTLGQMGWYAVMYRLAFDDDKENFANGNIRITKGRVM